MPALKERIISWAFVAYLVVAILTQIRLLNYAQYPCLAPLEKDLPEHYMHGEVVFSN